MSLSIFVFIFFFFFSSRRRHTRWPRDWSSDVCSSDLHPSYGVLPYWLSFVTAYEFNWLLKGWVAMALVVVATAWAHVGYNIAFFLAGLLAIPTSVIEAASVDGAGPIRRFRSIVFPLLSPITFYLLGGNLIFSFFGSFRVIHAVTQCGAGKSTEIVVFTVDKDGFVGLNPGAS